MNVNEIEIQAPWGKIAAKLWGDEKNEAVLLFHGISDNAGTFDRLIPLLPNNYYYIGMDLPGHGKSSHWPATSFIHTLDILLAYRVVTEHFKRNKYIIIGHSYGGQIAYFYTQLYPDNIEKLIMLDTLHLYPVQTNRVKNHLKSVHNAYFATMKKLQGNSPPEYTYEEALDRMITNRRYGELTREAAIPLLDRMIIPQENGKIRLSLDQRIKFLMNPLLNFRSMVDFIKKTPVLCPVLIILASESTMQQFVFKDVLKVHNSSRNVKIKSVEGGHDVHNVSPERVAPLIITFLIRKSKL